MTSSIHPSHSTIKKDPDEDPATIVIGEDEDDWHTSLLVGINDYAIIESGTVLIELMKKYKVELNKTKTRSLDKGRAKVYMIKHINNIHLYQAALTDLCREDYLNEMVDILTFLCNFEMESSLSMNTDNSEMDYTHTNNNEIDGTNCQCKNVDLKNLEVAQRINNYLTIFLFGEEMYIQHVLMKIKPIRHTVLNHIFKQHFFVREVKDISDEGFCRGYILLLKWKEISSETLDLNKLTVKFYQRTVESIVKSDYLKNILVPSYTSSTSAFLHIINSTASLTNRYFQYYRKTKKVQEIQPIIDVRDSSDDDITQVTFDDITNFRPPEATEPLECMTSLAADIEVIGDWLPHRFEPSINGDKNGASITHQAQPNSSTEESETIIESAAVSTEEIDINVDNVYVLVPEKLTEIQPACMLEVKDEPEAIEETITDTIISVNTIQSGQITPPPTPARDEAQAHINSEQTKETVEENHNKTEVDNNVMFNVTETVNKVVENSVERQITNCEQNSVSSIELKTPSDVSDGEDSGGSDKDSGFFGSDRIPNLENDDNSQRTQTEQKDVERPHSRNWTDKLNLTVLNKEQSEEYFENESNNNSSPNSPVTLENQIVAKEVEVEDDFALNEEEADDDDDDDNVDEDLLLEEPGTILEVTEEMTNVPEEDGIEETTLQEEEVIQDEFEPLFKLLREQGVYCVSKVTQISHEEETERLQVTQELRQIKKPTLLYESPNPAAFLRKNLGNSDIISLPFAKRSRLEDIQPMDPPKIQTGLKRTNSDRSSTPATKKKRGRPKGKVRFL